MIEQSTLSSSRSSHFTNTQDIQLRERPSKAAENPELANGLNVRRNPVQQLLYERIRKTANINSTVLITGESGTGKTTIARMIHEQSERRNSPFVTVNCASLPHDLIEAELFGHKSDTSADTNQNYVGCFQAAASGTLFLDEIGDLPLDLQPRLLSLIQDKIVSENEGNESPKADVRLIVATHQNLSERCKRGEFRDDLYYRLNVLQLQAPPLRDRITELPTFIQNLLTKIALKQNAPRPSLNREAMGKLQNHHWPGNIRELENVLLQACAFCHGGVIGSEDIVIDENRGEYESNVPDSIDAVFHGKTLAEIERLAIVATLEYCNGNKALTARTLGISEKSIYNKMKRLNIQY